MANPVWSQAFIQYTSETPNSSFAVPEGFTAIIRQWSAAQDIGGWLFAVNIQDSDEAPYLTIVRQEAAGVINYASGEGRWVVPSEGVISIFVSDVGDAPAFYVGGYLLRNTYSS